MTRPFYTDAQRAVQDEHQSRAIADRLLEHTVRTALHHEDRAFIERAPFFFLATASQDGWPECSYKGGKPGFVRVVDDVTLAFTDEDGNGQFRSLGNVAENPRVQLLFIDFEDPQRLRIHATAARAGRAVTFTVARVFPNCPRYIHAMALAALSPHVGDLPPEPAWKRDPRFCDALRPGAAEQGLADAAASASDPSPRRESTQELGARHGSLRDHR